MKLKAKRQTTVDFLGKENPGGYDEGYDIGRDVVVELNLDDFSFVEDENWKYVPDYDDKYVVSKWGDVYSYHSNKFLKHSTNPAGYHHVSLYKDKVGEMVFIHRLVAKLFVENPDNNEIVCHLDDDKDNNHADNLIWGDYKTNTRHITDRGGWDSRPGPMGESNRNSYLQESDVRSIIQRSLDGEEYKDIANDYPNIGKEQIRRITTKKAWKHIWKDFEVVDGLWSMCPNCKHPEMIFKPDEPKEDECEKNHYQPCYCKANKPKKIEMPPTGMTTINNEWKDFVDAKTREWMQQVTDAINERKI